MTIKDLFNKYPQLEDLLNTYNFEKIYTQLQPDEKGIFTEACLEVLDINPLKYLDYVPNAFAADSKIKSITIPDNVTSIGNSAFKFCSSLTNIEIPDSVTSIGNAAFFCCYTLTSVRIPSSVMNIDSYAFYDCNELEELQFKGTKSQWRSIKKGKKLFSWPYGVICNDGDLQYKR